jgi:hypothetical protein
VWPHACLISTPHAPGGRSTNLAWIHRITPEEQTPHPSRACYFTTLHYLSPQTGIHRLGGLSPPARVRVGSLSSSSGPTTCERVAPNPWKPTFLPLAPLLPNLALSLNLPLAALSMRGVATTSHVSSSRLTLAKLLRDSPSRSRYSA